MTRKQEFALNVISEYIAQNGVKVPVEFHFVDNINDSWILYAHDPKIRRSYLLQDFSDKNGLMLPFEGAKYHVLIRNDYSDYECTIIHESTHIIDYDRFRVLFNNGNIDIEFHQFYECMCLYSEFHARRMAHEHYFQNLSNTNIVQTIWQELLNIIPSVNELEKEIRHHEDFNTAPTSLLYDLMQYLGRIFTCKLDISQIDDFSDNIKNLYASLGTLDENWNNTTFQAVDVALRRLYE